jgi:16S rRNA (adenine1518-N6/adenine1519-N6)-dimethyltransferase
VFRPIPEVDSMLISLEKNNEVDQNLIDFTRLIFENKRKTLYNNLLSNIKLDSNTAINIMQKLNINPNARSEQLSIEIIKNLYLECKK